MAENRIKELRESQNMTLVNLRDAVNKVLKEKNILVNKKLLQVTDSQLSFYENGKRSPRNENIWGAIAKVFNTSITDVMGFTSDDVNKIADPHFPQILSNFMKDTGNEKLSATELQQFIASLGTNEEFIKYMHNELEKSTHDEVFQTYNKKINSSPQKEVKLSLPPSKTEHEKLSIYGVPVLTDSITSFINHRDFIVEKLGESIDSLKLDPEIGREIWEEKYKNNLPELEFIDFQEKIKNRKFKDCDVKTQEKLLTMLVKKIKMEKDEITFYWNF